MSGIFAISSLYNCSKDLFYGTDYHSHLGTRHAGLAVLYEDEITVVSREMEQNQFKPLFKGIYKNLLGSSGIGCIGNEAQPFKIKSRLGTLAVCTDGLVSNNKFLTKKLMNEGIPFTNVNGGIANTSELVAKIIAGGSSITDGIKNMYNSIEGSISLVMLSNDGIYAAADRHPLVIGQKQNTFAVASESCAFPNLDYEMVRDIGSKEIVRITPENIFSSGESMQDKVCAFKWIYTGSPASCFRGRNAGEVRERCGALLAEKDKQLKTRADLVIGIPDSGIYHAIGYSNRLNVPFGMALMKYTPGYGRSYTPTEQKDRDEIASYKLVPVKSSIEENNLVVLDDSIVRGTQLKNRTIPKLRKNGAEKIHVRISSPPLMFPCVFNFSTKDKSELIARKMIQTIEGTKEDNIDISEYLDPNTEKYKQMVELIRQYIDVDSIMFQTLEDMVDAIGLPKENLCTHCWDGSM